MLKTVSFQLTALYFYIPHNFTCKIPTRYSVYTCYVCVCMCMCTHAHVCTCVYHLLSLCLNPGIRKLLNPQKCFPN